VSKGTTTVLPAEAVRKVVDLTGAGDMFAAGFVFGLTAGMDFKRAASLGSFAAAEIISIAGARPEVRLGHLARMRGLLN
ncbi:MAG: PfkB family carbohydrate kinase, partial [Hyphomicrobium sp.]